MKKLLALFVVAAAAQAATDDAARCDLAGASFLDPQRPADVAFRYFHPVYADIAAVHADVEACQRAYDSSKDARYLYQAGNIYASYYLTEQMQQRLRRNDGEDKKGALLGAELFARGYYQRAAKANYLAARYEVARAASFAHFASMSSRQADAVNDGEEALKALLAEAPLLAHLGLGQLHVMRGALENHAEQALQHFDEATKHYHEAVALNADVAYLLLSTMTTANYPQWLAPLTQAVDKQPNPANQSALALLLYQQGKAAEGDQVFAALQAQAATNADAQTACDFVLGLRKLHGWATEKDEAAALPLLRKAAQGGYPGAAILLSGLEAAR